MSNIRSTRKCPMCDNGFVYVSDLAGIPDGASCSYCHKIIAIDFFYSAGIPVVLTLLIIMLFRLDMGILGYMILMVFAFFIVAYKSFFVAYLPLKHYSND